MSAATILQSAGSLGPARTNWPSILITIDRKTTQVGQARIAGAEIVERDLYAHRVQAGQHLLGFGAVAHQARFGDLDLQTFGVET